MTTADLILTNARVLTMDAGFKIYEPGAVAIQGNSIIAVGPAGEINSRYPNTSTVDCKGKVLMPGLINAHTHVPMTLLRGLADDLRLDVWLMGYMMPVERQFVSPEFVRLGTLLACAEMIRSGITCFADMYYFESDIAAATAEAGMRAVCGQSVMKFPTPDAESYEEALAHARAFIEQWKGHELIIPAISPHAPYTCTPEIFHAATALALEMDVPLHTHLSETAQEVENMRAQEGMPVIPYVKKQGVFDAKVIAAHCVHVDEGEIRSMQHAHVGIVHNPTSNLKLASGMAPIKRMLELGATVGIGTDGPASNNDLDMFEEIRLAALLAKGSSGDPTALPARTALLMATRMGAEALHIEHLTGSIQPGKRADLILIDLDPLHNSPRFFRDPNAAYAQVVYSAKSTDVSDVMINGKWVLKDRKLLTLNAEALIQQSNEYARKIDAFLIKREKSVLSKLLALGGALEQESFEVQVKIPIRKIEPIVAALQKPGIEILRSRHYREYDNYFTFDDPEQGRLRYREDDFIDENGQVTNVRSRLTLIGVASERHFTQGVLLSRSRYLAPATHSLRFYREYFNPSREIEIEKDRLRYLVSYKDTEFFINIDQIDKPQLGNFLEIKSRTWSKQDSQIKSKLMAELLLLLEAPIEETVAHDYFEIVEKS